MARAPPYYYVTADGPKWLDIDATQCLGSGMTGTVFRGTLTTNTGSFSIAAKVLAAVLPVPLQKVVQKEVATWDAVRHDHILPFFGSFGVGMGQMCLVSPHMERGNMKEYLVANPNAPRLTLLRQVADALLYLHRDAHRVHGDLKCVNVLISGNGRALLADFGLSALVGRADPTMTAVRRLYTPQFAAPEILIDRACSEGGVLPPGATIKPRSKTTFSDIYAFGMLIYEAYAGVAPWHGYEWHNIINIVLAGHQPPRPQFGVQMSDRLWGLCTGCWDFQPSRRPVAGAVFAALQKLEANPQ
ncbi:kinase-like protein [Auricularia subglabra TFB-10046 SS5]|nr:kinase-like protein [Auricularia subglabra TFB-10046 SS5]